MRKGSALKSRYAYILLFLVLCLGTYLSANFFYGPSWINGADNYVYVSDARTIAFGQQGPAVLGEDDVKLLLLAGIAFFYKLLGYGSFSSAVLGILCFLGTIVLVYFIGKKIHSTSAGLFSAFLYAIFPLVVSQSSSVGDDVPAAFLIALAVFFLLEGSGKERYRRYYYVLSGFIAAASYLIVPEGALGAFLVVALAAITALRSRRENDTKNLLFCLLGCGLGMVFIFALAMALYGNPLFIFETANTGLGMQSTLPGIFNYVGYMFPLGIMRASFESGFFVVPSWEGFLNVLGYIDRYDFGSIAFGYFGIALVLSVLYLIIIREKRALLPLLWFSVMFLYLSFGSQNLLRYVPVASFERFLVPLCPAVVLVIGIALADVLNRMRKETAAARFTSYAILLYAMIIVFATSYFSIQYIQYSQYRGVLPLVQIGSYIDSLPSNATIAGPIDLPWVLYTDYNHMAIVTGGIDSEANCSVTQIFSLRTGYYFVGPSNGNYSSCGAHLVFVPTKYAWLENYTMFAHWGPDFYNAAVYNYGSTGT